MIAALADVAHKGFRCVFNFENGLDGKLIFLIKVIKVKKTPNRHMDSYHNPQFGHSTLFGNAALVIPHNTPLIIYLVI